MEYEVIRWREETDDVIESRSDDVIESRSIDKIVIWRKLSLYYMESNNIYVSDIYSKAQCKLLNY